MIDEEFTDFMRSCNLSNEQIAEMWEVSNDTVRRWRTGRAFPSAQVRLYMMRCMTMSEQLSLHEAIHNYEAKRK